MSGTSSTRWFFSDWLSDPGIRSSSLAARGLWKDLLCLMGMNSGRDYGYLKINGSIPTIEIIAKLVQSTPEDLAPLVRELEKNGVFSRTRNGVMYCRRMVRTQKNRENGKLGGNPNLLSWNENQDPLNHSGVYPTHNPTQEGLERKKEANGNGVGLESKRKPRHGQKSKNGRVWLDRDTEEFKAYAADYFEKHHASVVMQWNNSGAWFNLNGENETKRGHP